MRALFTFENVESVRHPERSRGISLVLLSIIGIPRLHPVPSVDGQDFARDDVWVRSFSNVNNALTSYT